MVVNLTHTTSFSKKCKTPIELEPEGPCETDEDIVQVMLDAS